MNILQILTALFIGGGLYYGLFRKVFDKKGNKIPMIILIIVVNIINIIVEYNATYYELARYSRLITMILATIIYVFFGAKDDFEKQDFTKENRKKFILKKILDSILSTPLAFAIVAPLTFGFELILGNNREKDLPHKSELHQQECYIKGNIEFEGDEKIYHVPGCSHYNDTIINKEYGERYFCTEQEAKKAGRRKCKDYQ